MLRRTPMTMAADAAPQAGDPEVTGATPVFVARGLCKSYGSGEAAVHALRDLDILPGEFVVLLGLSGSGKSTPLSFPGGLDAPTSGRAAWRDHELAGADEAAPTACRRDHAGFVFPFHRLIPSLTARENVALVAGIAPDPMRAEEALALIAPIAPDRPRPQPVVGRRTSARRGRAVLHRSGRPRPRAGASPSALGPPPPRPQAPAVGCRRDISPSSRP